MNTLQGLLQTVLILGGQLTVILGRIHEHFAKITSDSVDPGKGSIDNHLEKDLQRLYKDHMRQCSSWGGPSTVNLGRVQ